MKPRKRTVEHRLRRENDGNEKASFTYTSPLCQIRADGIQMQQHSFVAPAILDQSSRDPQYFPIPSQHHQFRSYMLNQSHGSKAFQMPNCSHPFTSLSYILHNILLYTPHLPQSPVLPHQTPIFSYLWISEPPIHPVSFPHSPNSTSLIYSDQNSSTRRCSIIQWKQNVFCRSFIKPQMGCSYQESISRKLCWSQERTIPRKYRCVVVIAQK